MNRDRLNPGEMSFYDARQIQGDAAVAQALCRQATANDCACPDDVSGAGEGARVYVDANGMLVYPTE